MEAFLYWKLISKNPHDPWAGAWGLPPGREFSCWSPALSSSRTQSSVYFGVAWTPGRESFGEPSCCVDFLHGGGSPSWGGLLAPGPP